MLSVFICEDNASFLRRISNCVDSKIANSKIDAKVVCVTPSPDIILDYLDKNDVHGIYFLDLDLNSDIDGLELASRIRKYDPRAFIVIITTDADSYRLTLKYVLEVMDYITKSMDNLEDRISHCINTAYERYTADVSQKVKRFEVKLTDDTTLNDGTIFRRSDYVNLYYQDILYFEMSTEKSHRVIAVTINGVYEFRNDLNKVLKLLDRRFAKCSKSYIVNTEKIQSMNKSTGRIKLNNNQDLYVGRAYLEELRQRIREEHKFL